MTVLNAVDDKKGGVGPGNAPAGVNWKDNTDFYTRGMYQIYFACFIAFLNSAINGYDLSLFNNLATLGSFGNSFSANGTQFSAGSSLYALTTSMLQIGSVLGCFFVGFVADTFGRRGGMQLGSTLILIGVALELATETLGVFIFGRFLIGFGVVFVTTAAPTYTIEIAHPQFRSQATALYNIGWNVGAIPCSLILFGATYQDQTSPTTWRIPVGVQGVFSAVVLLGSFFIPESPRWLMAKGREDEARQFFIHYHANDKPDHPVIDFTMGEIKDALEDERRQNTASYAAFIRGRPMLHRLGILFAVAFFSQWAGNWIAGGFTGVVNTFFGFNSPQAALGAGIIPSVVSFITSFISSLFVERTGRRPLLIYGSAIFSASFFIILFLLLGYNNNPDLIGVAVVAFVILQIFNIAYSFVWTPLNALYPCEILPFSARAKGMAFLQLSINFVNVIQTWVLVYANNDWGFHFFAFFGFFNAIAVFIIWKYWPETKGRSLEKIDELFEDPNPVAKSLQPVTVYN